MLKVGIIGAGIICGRHINAVESSGRAKVVAVCDLIQERAENYAKKCNALAFTDYEKMIDDVEIDAVIVNLPHSLHVTCGEIVAKKGIHILMEKPLATSIDECNRLIKACRDNNVLMQVGHVQRFFPENIMAHEIIKSKELGELCMIQDTRTNFYFDENRPKWFLNKKLSGGGILMNFGAHSLDKILYLTDSDVSSIVGDYKIHGSEVEGSAQFMLTTKSNVSASVSLCGFNKHGVNCTMLYFTNGVLKLETGKALSILKDTKFEEICKSSIEITFKNQLDSFLDSIIDGKPCEVCGDYGLKVITAIESIYNSKNAKEGI